jgi:hypothetical protein
LHHVGVRREELRGYALDFSATAVLEPPFSRGQLVEAVGAALNHAKWWGIDPIGFILTTAALGDSMSPRGW